MCPLRVILIFLSAMLAGFFFLRGLRSQPEEAAATIDVGDAAGAKDTVTISSKVGSSICSGFWTFVDMASGRYLWKQLVSQPPLPAASGLKL